MEYPPLESAQVGSRRADRNAHPKITVIPDPHQAGVDGTLYLEKSAEYVRFSSSPPSSFFLTQKTWCTRQTCQLGGWLSLIEILQIPSIGTALDTAKHRPPCSAGDYLGIKAKLGSTSDVTSVVEKRLVLPPELTPHRLGRYIGAAKCCWVLEDFHKVSQDHGKKLSQIMKVFMDLANEWPALKIVAIGAVDTARLVVQYDPEMSNRVSEIEVPLMSSSEIREILAKGEDLLNISIDSVVKREITLLSNGLASVCHSLGLALCRAKELVETSGEKIRIGEEELQKAIKDYIEDSSDSLKSVLDIALYRKRRGQFDNFKIVIEGLAGFPQEGGTKSEIFDAIRLNHPNYPQSNLVHCLKELQSEGRGEFVRYDQNSGRYSFSNPFYRAYALAYLNKDKTQRKKLIKTDASYSLTIRAESIAKIVDAMLSAQNSRSKVGN